MVVEGGLRPLILHQGQGEQKWCSQGASPLVKGDAAEKTVEDLFGYYLLQNTTASS